MRFLFLFLVLMSHPLAAQSFKNQQLRYERVRVAYAEKWPALRRQLVQKGVNPEAFQVFLRAFKTEATLEVWVRTSQDLPFLLFKTYRIVATSGGLGPKRTEGDGQVPEGFYSIDRFNPVSNFYLSLGLNYPNESDRRLGRQPFGGDVFIHGSNVTIGCLPLTDNIIKEVYVLAVQARNAGQARIPVHIFPFALSNSQLQRHQSSKHLAFWQSLNPGYAYFERTRKLLVMQVGKNGMYQPR